jgi:hypothetical protein
LHAGNQGGLFFFRRGGNQLAGSVLFGTQVLELEQGLAPRDIRVRSLVNERLVGTASALRSLDGVWVFSKKSWVNHETSLTFIRQLFAGPQNLEPTFGRVEGDILVVALVLRLLLVGASV